MQLGKAQPKLKTGTWAPSLVGLLGVLALGGLLGGWMAQANISGAVVASGAVAIKGQPKTIQHLDGGIVSRIKVANGETVAQDQLLVRLDDTMLTSNLKIYRNRLRESLAQRTRLQAERDGADQIDWSNSDRLDLGIEIGEHLQHSQSRLFAVRRDRLIGGIEQLDEKVKQYRNQIKGVSGLRTSKRKQVAFMETELTGLRALKKEGNTTLNRLLALERQKVDLDGQIAEHDAEIARIKNSINETRTQLLQVRREADEGVLSELRTLTKEVNDMEQQIFATQQQLRRVDIRAPVSGIIHELSVFTIGGVIGPGAPVMQIVPQNETFEIEANVEPQFIDELFIGQPAGVRFSAFNQRTTPEVDGTITGVSPSSIIDQNTGLAFYKVRIGVAPDQMARLGDQKLIPGMPVETFIKTRERTVLTYLVRPFVDQVYRAFREE